MGTPRRPSTKPVPTIVLVVVAHRLWVDAEHPVDRIGEVPLRVKVRHGNTSRCNVVNESAAPVFPEQGRYVGRVAPLREVLREELNPATLALVSGSPEVSRSGDADGEKDVALERLVAGVVCERNTEPPEQTIL
jgi:hypothetical protein